MTLASSNYTSPYGNTVPAQNMSQFQSALSSITGVAPIPQDVQPQIDQIMQNNKQQFGQAQQNISALKGASNVQQPMADFNSIMQLASHDQNLQQQYMNPNVLGAATGTPPQMTLENVGQPFAGFSDPSLAYTAGSKQYSGIADTINNLGKLIGTNLDILGKQTGQQYQAYKDASDFALQRAGQIADFYKDILKNKSKPEDLAKLQLEWFDRGYSYDPATGKVTPMADNIDDYVDQVRNFQIKYEDVPSQLKPLIAKKLKERGTTAEKVKMEYDGLRNSQRMLNQIYTEWINAPEVEKRMPFILSDNFPGIAPSRAKIKSTFLTSLEGELRKSTVGGRITQQEIQWIRDAVLGGPFDSSESVRAKMQGAMAQIDMKLNNPDYIIGSSDLGGSAMNSGNVTQIGKYQVTIE